MKNGEHHCFEPKERILFASMLTMMPGRCLTHTCREHASLSTYAQRHGRQLQERKTVFLADVAVLGQLENFPAGAAQQQNRVRSRQARFFEALSTCNRSGLTEK